MTMTMVISLECMGMQAFTVRSRLEMAVQRQPSGRSHSGASRAGSGPLHRSAHMSQEPCIIDELADVPTALHNYFQSLVQSQGDKLDHDRWVACCVQGSWSGPLCKVGSRVFCFMDYGLTWTLSRLLVPACLPAQHNAPVWCQK